LSLKTGLHTPLVGGPRVLYPERHLHITEATEGSNEHGGGLVHISEGYLVVAWVGILETQEFTPGNEVHDLVDSWERERILWACLVQACVIYAHPPFPILSCHKYQIGCPIWVIHFFHKAISQKPGQLFARGPALLLIKALHALLDRLGTGLDVEGMLRDFLGDTRHFCWAPCKYVSIVLEDVDELTFLFRIQGGLNLHGFGWVPSIDLHGLGILVNHENARCRGIFGPNGAVGN
jgi:hypothetical protein